MSKTKRNGNIELLRFCFCILIVLLHFNSSIFNGELFTASYLGVEFFFMVTGVFLGRKLKKENELHRAESFDIAAKEGLGYVWKKICGLYPYFFVATLIGLAVRIQIDKSTPKHLLTVTGDLGFLQLFGFSCFSTTGTLWYLCAMFFTLLMIYPFVRKHYNAYVYSFAILFPPILLGIFTRTHGHLNLITENFFGVFNTGLLRGIAIISIGLVVNELCDKVKEIPTNRANRVLCTIGELILYSLVFIYLIFVKRCASDYVVVVLMAFGLILTLSEKSFLYGKLDNKFFMFLGKSSMIIFMCHFFWVNNISCFSKHLPSSIPQSKATDIILGFVLTFVTSVIVYFGGKLLRFLFRKVKNYITAEPKTIEQA